jgi:hypothetical protein
LLEAPIPSITGVSERDDVRLLERPDLHAHPVRSKTAGCGPPTNGAFRHTKFCCHVNDEQRESGTTTDGTFSHGNLRGVETGRLPLVLGGSGSQYVGGTLEMSHESGRVGAME